MPTAPAPRAAAAKPLAVRVIESVLTYVHLAEPLPPDRRAELAELLPDARHLIPLPDPARLPRALWEGRPTVPEINPGYVESAVSGALHALDVFEVAPAPEHREDVAWCLEDFVLGARRAEGWLGRRLRPGERALVRGCNQLVDILYPRRSG